jgi:hypothetical protein
MVRRELNDGTITEARMAAEYMITSADEIQCI